LMGPIHCKSIECHVLMDLFLKPLINGIEILL